VTSQGPGLLTGLPTRSRLVPATGKVAEHVGRLGDSDHGDPDVVSLLLGGAVRTDPTVIPASPVIRYQPAHPAGLFGVKFPVTAHTRDDAHSGTLRPSQGKHATAKSECLGVRYDVIIAGVEREIVSADGTRLVARRTGDGIPIVMVHGSAGGPDSWDDIANLLADEFEV
jgi:hypothetical protein